MFVFINKTYFWIWNHSRNFHSYHWEIYFKYIFWKIFTKNIINPILEENESNPVDQAYRASQILTRPNINLEKLSKIEIIGNKTREYSEEIQEQAEINIKYKGYIEKEKENVAKLQRMENIKIPDNFDFSKVASLSSEALQKMNNIRPKNIAQASRISGVSPADINVLLIYLGK